MKRLFLICLIFQFTNYLFCQIQNIDSLEKVLRTQKPESDPEERMQLYWNILLCYWNTDLEKNISYATEALEYAEKEQHSLWSARFNRTLGISYTFKGEFDSAFQHLERAIEYATKANDQREKNAAYMQIGNVYLTAGDKESALKYYTDVLIPLEENQQYEVYTNTLFNIGNIHFDLHNYEKALEYFKRGLTVAEKHSITRSIASINAAIGNFFNSQQQLDSAVTYVHKSYDIAHNVNDIPQIIISTQMLAGMYSDLKEYDKAQIYVDECMEAATQFGDKLKLIVAWLVKAKVSFGMQDYKECEVHAYKAWEADSTNLSIAENAVAYLCLANIYLGNPSKASHFLNQYKTIRDQLDAKSLHDSLTSMEVKYETEKKEMRIETLEKEKQLYIWLIIAVALTLLMSLGVLFYRHRLNVQKRKIAEQEREIARGQVKQLEQEKQIVATQAILDGETAERSRLARDLHDGLGGMLSIVKLNMEKELNLSTIARQNPEQHGSAAMKMLDESIGELRRIAHHMMPISLMHSGLRVSLEDFCHAVPNAHFQFMGEDSRLDPRLEVVLYRCAYELINNAVKYSNAAHINVQLVIDKKIIALTVDDDGMGFDPDCIVSGTGLENIRARVIAYNGKVTVRSALKEGTEIIIEIESI